MTVICWDGKTLAADKLGDACGLRRTSTKIHRASFGLFGCAGTASRALRMLAWLEAGAIPADVPEFQLTDDYQDIIVVRLDGSAWTYARGPYPFPIQDPFHAIGCGRDFAIAAMYLGCSPARAVEVASIFDTGCGGGVDTLELT